MASVKKALKNIGAYHKNMKCPNKKPNKCINGYNLSPIYTAIVLAYSLCCSIGKITV
jgi:hypothetical protein